MLPPLEVDTEFYHPPIVFDTPLIGSASPTLTVQVRGIAQRQGKIFAHPDSVEIARHPLFEAGFIVVDYLKSLGYQSVLRQATQHDLTSGIPTMQIELFAFFAVAELVRIVREQYRDDILSACLSAEKRGNGIVQGRRLRTFTRIQGRYNPQLRMPWIINLNGIDYGINLVFHDTCAVHGAVGYAQLCQNTGVNLIYKDNFTKSEKGDMGRMYVERPEDFDNYALGDLYNYEALFKNAELVSEIYEKLGIENYARLPRLTTGATVRDLIEVSIAKFMRSAYPDSDPREIVNKYCKYATADYVKKLTETTAAYNAKVDGGRCRNNRPTDTVAQGIICDIDISSCYGEGLRTQLYPVGIPIIHDYPLESEINSYLTLRQFLEKYSKELVPGLWQARVSTLPEYSLKYAQDFLMSWFPPKDIRNLPSDNDFVETDEWWNIDNVGLIKTFTNQINLAFISHDFIQWLDNIASVRQRKELLDNLYVQTAMYYPVSDRVDSPEVLRHRHENHDGRNTCTIKKIRGKTTKISIHQECHAWYAVSMGDMLINKLLIERAKHDKKTPLNELYKLCVNTTYGDMVSPYFTIGNVVVGNNITARARTTAWYMEKGLNGYQTITDGCSFDVNKVVYPKSDRRVNGEMVVNAHRTDTRDSNLEFRPLATDTDAYKLSNLFDKDKDRFLVSNAVWKHLQSLFPSVDVLHACSIDIKGESRNGLYGLEIKDVHDTAVFHGTANYAFFKNGVLADIKMRSYSRNPHHTIGSDERDNVHINNDEYYPAKVFLTGLYKDANNLARQSAYLKENILKVGDYSRHYESKYEDSGGFPGMTLARPALLREFSLAQFTYQNLTQYRAWEREAEKLRRQYGQTYEMFFLNDDGTLDYQAMIEDIDNKIGKGWLGFWNQVDKRRMNTNRQQSVHPVKKLLEESRRKLGLYYGYKNVFDTVIDIEVDNSGDDE